MPTLDKKLRAKLYPVRELSYTSIRQHRGDFNTQILNIRLASHTLSLVIDCPSCGKDTRIRIKKIRHKYKDKYKVYHECEICFYLILVVEDDLIYTYQSNQRFLF